MSERAFQNALYPWLAFTKAHALSCPNYTPNGWFECDMWSVTKAGYSQEFEIKLSRSDFKADAKKGPDKYTLTRHGSKHPDVLKRDGLDLRTKHVRLGEADNTGPSHFYFVTPTGLVALDEVPTWAGLIEMREVTGWGKYPAHLAPVVIKPAPKLHRAKVDDKILAHCRTVFYHRFWRLRQGFPENTTETTDDH